MMIAARLAGGNLFFCLFCGGGAFGSSSEHSDFFGGDFVGGASFFWGGVGCVLDCKCWKKLKND